MNKIELYSVISSRGSYDDYHEYHEPIIYATKEAAEKKVQEIYDANKVEPFPFDWCTEEEFTDLLVDHKSIPDNDFEYYEWLDAKEKQELFNGCFINEIDYYE